MPSSTRGKPGSAAGKSIKKKDKADKTAKKATRNTDSWHVTCSPMAARIHNPIRAISDKAGSLIAGENAQPLIKLSVGDPTLDKNFFRAPQSHVDAVKAALDSHDFNGYVPASGAPEARQAVSDFWAKNFISFPEDAQDAAAQQARERKVASIPKEHVVLTSGGSHAIQLAITSICGKGDNVLLPSPCFPHYITICDTFNIKKKFYKLDPRKHWEVNLKQVEAQCDARTKMIVITNPSNPCGSNFSRQHVEEIVKLAEKLKLPIFSDEIYAGMVFQKEKKYRPTPGEKQRHVFTSVVDINTSVPRVVLGGTAKQFAVPGWRLCWLIYASDSSVGTSGEKGDGVVAPGQKHPASTGHNLLYGIEQQALLIVGPTTLAQGALPSFLSNYSTSMAPRAQKSAEELERESQDEKDEAFFYRYVTQIEKCARTFVNALNAKCRVPHTNGVGAKGEERPHHMVYAQMPQGSMYVMMKVNVAYFQKDVVHDEYSFFENLLKEQQVQLVPGNAFRRPGYLRAVITRPESVLLEAVDRIAAFCHNHYDAEAAAQHAAAKKAKRPSEKKQKAGKKGKKAKGAEQDSAEAATAEGHPQAPAEEGDAAAPQEGAAAVEEPEAAAASHETGEEEEVKKEEETAAPAAPVPDVSMDASHESEASPAADAGAEP